LKSIAPNFSRRSFSSVVRSVLILRFSMFLSSPATRP
jgi:hypothetical protein